MGVLRVGVEEGEQHDHTHSDLHVDAHGLVGRHELGGYGPAVLGCGQRVGDEDKLRTSLAAGERTAETRPAQRSAVPDSCKPLLKPRLGSCHKDRLGFRSLMIISLYFASLHPWITVHAHAP